MAVFAVLMLGALFATVVYQFRLYVKYRRTKKITETKCVQETQNIKQLPGIPLWAILLMWKFTTFLQYISSIDSICQIKYWKWRFAFINDLNLGKELFKNSIFCEKQVSELFHVYSNGAYDLNLLAIMTDLFMAGGDTTANQIAWAMLHLIRNPGIQAKIQEEIHCCWHGSTSIPSRQAQAQIWGDPQIFRPERFLSEDKTKVIKHEAMVAFSTGQRKCFGEKLARDSLFLFVVSICQKFKLSPDPQLKWIPSLRGFGAGLSSPAKFYMVATPYLKQEQ